MKKKIKHKWIIFVTGGIWQLKGIKAAKKIGLKVIVIDHDMNAVGNKYCNIFINEDLNNFDLIEKKLLDLELNIVGVISYCSEAGMYLAAKIRKAFSLIGPSIETSKILTDKGLQRKKFSYYKLMVPKWSVFRDQKSVYKKILLSSKTQIIKPCDSSGSRGVNKILPVYTRKKMKKLINNAFKFSSSSKIILEDYVEGDEFTVEVYFVKKKMYLLGVTKKYKIKSVNNNVSEDIFSYNFENKIKKNIIKIINKAYNVCGYSDGPGHAEIIILNKKIYIIEIAGRGPGFDMFDEFLSYSSGLNLPQLQVKHYSGIKIKSLKIKNNLKCHIHYFKSKKGKVKKVTGLPAVHNIKGRLIRLFYSKNRVYQKATTDGDRLGYILIYGKSATKNRSLIENYKKKINFEMVTV